MNLSLQECFYCGLSHSKEIPDRVNETAKGKLLSNTIVKCNGIDRIDSSKGYVESNVCSCCKYCNTAKNTMSVEEFLEFIKRIYNHNFASKNLNRKFIGIEKDSKYFEIAMGRIENA